MPPKMRCSLVLAGLLGVLPPVGAEPAKEELAMRLITAMRLDFTALDALQWRVRIKSPSASDVSACLARADYKRFTAPMARAVAKGLSVDDMTDLLAFYSSPAGRKFTDAALVDVHKRADPGVREEYPEISPDDYAQISSFVKSAPYAHFRAIDPYEDARQLAARLLSECRGGM